MTIMTIAQYLPRWLRGRLQSTASQETKAPSKKDRQVLPTLPKPPRALTPLDDDGAPLRFRIYWRM